MQLDFEFPEASLLLGTHVRYFHCLKSGGILYLFQLFQIHFLNRTVK